MQNKYGATQNNWFLLSEVMGLTKDLLPVVSHPNAKVSPNSALKQTGKVPSVFNGRGEVVGLGGWTQKQTTPNEIALWEKQHDYGICVQTRYVRAMDIDVEDTAKANAISNFIQGFFGKPVALRYRIDTGKCLIPFFCEGELFKQKVEVDGGVIEFLATGQQFVAYGTHPSGTTYQWENEGQFPTLTKEEADKLWLMLCGRFGTSEPTSARGLRKRGEYVGSDDPIVEQLDALDYGSDGAVYIECPFKAEHTMDSGHTETAYFPKGTNGYAEGHFRCLHAHCDGRTDDDFMRALEATAVPVSSFEPIPQAEDEPEPLPPFVRDKAGAILATRGNIRRALLRADVCGYDIHFDDFMGDILLRGDGEQYRVLQDDDYFNIGTHLEDNIGFKAIGTVMIREAVYAIAREQRFDLAQEYVKGLKWDGIPRIDRFFADYLGCKDDSLAQEAGRYLFTAFAGRGLVAGIKADMVPILIGKQGTMKSSVIEALSPFDGWFAEIALTGDEANRARQLKGKMVAEIGEMRGLWGNTIEDVKAFIAKRVDEWIPKYKEQAFAYKRRCVFLGTSNHYEILNDTTGNRRFIPLEVGEIRIDDVRRDVVQLWAEGKARFEMFGIEFAGVEKLLGEHNENYTMHDPWQEMITEWLNTADMDGVTPLLRSEGVTTGEILTCALGQARSSVNSGSGKRVSELMRAMGFEKKRRRGANGTLDYYWQRAVTQEG